MKKLFTSLAVLAMFSSVANAETVTIDFNAAATFASDLEIPTDASTGTVVNDYTFTVDGVSVKATKGTSNDAMLWRLTENAGGGLQYRLYKGATMTVTAPGNIQSISFTCGNANFSATNVTVTPGTLTNDSSAKTAEWTGDASTVVFTIGPSQNQQINTIVVNYGEGGGETPVDPTPGPGEDPDPVDPTPGDATVVSFNVNDATDIVGTYTPEVPAEGTSYGSAAKYQPLESLKLGDYVFTFTDGGNNNAPAYYDVMSTSTSTQKTIRVYGSATTPNTMTITAPEGKSFSAIKFAGSNGKANGAVTASVGTAVMPSASELTWGADEAVTTVTFTFGQTFRINSLEITEGEGGSTPVDPTPGPGDEDNTVILSTDFDANDGFTFEDGTLPEGLTYVWTRDKNYNYMKASCFKSGNHAVEGAFLVSPVLDLTNRNEITLTFNQALGYCSAEQAAEMLSLWVREENMDWSVELPIQAWPAAVEGKNFTAFESAGVYDLDQFKNKKIQLGWKYTSTTEVGPTWEIDAVKVTGKIDNAISDIEADVNAPVEYFNLQGVRVANPENGLYIMRQGNKVTKVIR